MHKNNILIYAKIASETPEQYNSTTTQQQLSANFSENNIVHKIINK